MGEAASERVRLTHQQDYFYDTVIYETESSSQGTVQSFLNGSYVESSGHSVTVQHRSGDFTPATYVKDDTSIANQQVASFESGTATGAPRR